MQIDKSFVWIPCGGMQRSDVVDTVIKGCVLHEDMGDHIWVATINNRGTVLFCYGLQLGHLDDGGPWKDQWFVKRIPEDAGPEIYDCPIEILEACVAVNDTWREQVRRWHETKQV